MKNTVLRAQKLEERFLALPIIAHVLSRLRRELPSNLHYHTLAHTFDVFHEVILFAALDRLTERMVELLAIGAAYHDAGFIVQFSKNEPVGASYAVQAMKKEGGYRAEELDAVRVMIEDTQVRPARGGIAQLPTQPLSCYLLDADLSNLGRADFFEKADLVRQEIGVPSSIDNLRNVQTLIHCHRWYTPAARKLRQRQKLENMRTLRKMIAGKV